MIASIITGDFCYRYRTNKRTYYKQIYGLLQKNNIGNLYKVRLISRQLFISILYSIYAGLFYTRGDSYKTAAGLLRL